jgi:tetratricopeptide (TPR) repeat protein
VLLFFASFFLLAQISAAEESAKAKLDSCIVYYQNGEYQKAVDSIKALIPLISDKRDEAEAYKYIGFSYCMLDMINKAKDFFKVALEKFPQLMIDTLEVPPNITVVFKQTKLETQMEKGELVEKEAPNSRPLIAALFGTTGLVSAVAGGYFIFKGFKSLRSYHNEKVDTTLMAYYWGNQKKEFMIGGVVSGFAIANAVTAIYVMVKKPSPKKQRVSLDVRSNKVVLSLSF